MEIVENWVQRPATARRCRAMRDLPDDQPNACTVCPFRDDDSVCGSGWCPGEEDPYIGDFVHTYYGEHECCGVVIGVIRNIAFQPVCYKVIVDGHDPAYIDFFAASDTYCDDRTGCSPYETALKLGYVPVNKDETKYYNKELDDVFYL